MHHFVLQVFCFLLMLSMVMTFYSQIQEMKIRFSHRVFDLMVVTAMLFIFFDGLTAWSVNNIDLMSGRLNQVFHLLFYIFIIFDIYLQFSYVIFVSGMKLNKFWKILLSIPFLLCAFYICINIKNIYIIHGETTNYSAGVAVTACMVCCVVYNLLSIILFAANNNHVNRRQRGNVYSFLAVTLFVLIIKIVFPELLITAVAPVFFVFRAFANEENPSLKKLLSEMEKSHMMAEEKLRSENQKQLLELSARALKERIEVMENYIQDEKVARHDRRHFESMLYSLLQQGKTEKALELLKQKFETEPRYLGRRCENKTVNALLEYSAEMAVKNGIEFDCQIQIPEVLSFDALEFSIALGNLIENAIHGIQKITEPEFRKYIKIRGIYKKQFLISIENPCLADVKLNDEGLPFTAEEGHGIGTKSVTEFIEKWNGDIVYDVTDGIFSVRMIL